MFDTEQLERTGNSDIFLAKYAPSGRQFWVRTAGAMGGISSHAIAVDTNGNAFITGQYFGKATWDGNSLIKSLGEADIFVTRLSGSAIPLRGCGGSRVRCSSSESFGPSSTLNCPASRSILPAWRISSSGHRGTSLNGTSRPRRLMFNDARSCGGSE